MAEFFQVSLATIGNILRLYRRTGDVAPQRHHRLRPVVRIDDNAREQLRRSLEHQPDMTLAELREQLARKNGLQLSTSKIYRVLQQMGAPKKKALHACERDSARVCQEYQRYSRKIAHCPAKKLKFIDETKVNLSMTRCSGRAVPCKRVQDATPKNYGRNVTIIGSLFCYGLDAVMTVEGATHAAVFRAYVSRVLAPTLRPGDVVVMDNLGAHKVAGIEEAITERGAELIYLPPYSPDHSPIESCWSKLKTKLRSL